MKIILTESQLKKVVSEQSETQNEVTDIKSEINTLLKQGYSGGMTGQQPPNMLIDRTVKQQSSGFKVYKSMSVGNNQSTSQFSAIQKLKQTITTPIISNFSFYKTLDNGNVECVFFGLTKPQQNIDINESVHKVRYFEGEEYDIPEQIDWLIMQKEFIYLGQGSGHKLKLINNIIHNLQKLQ
jgi:hypothetical protein